MSRRIVWITSSKWIKTGPKNSLFLPFLIKRFQIMEAHLHAKICHLKVGNHNMNLSMVTYVRNMSDVIIYVIRNGNTAIIKNVENFAKRHVINANNLQISHFAHLDYKLWIEQRISEFCPNEYDIILNSPRR